MNAEDPQTNTQPANANTPDAPAEPEPTLPAAPALNREQRRAQSKGKKGATPGFHPANSAGNVRGGGRPANAPIQNKIPRTGHK